MIEHAAGRAEPKSSLFSDSSDISYTLMKVIGVSERNPGSERGRIIYSDEDLIDPNWGLTSVSPTIIGRYIAA